MQTHEKPDGIVFLFEPFVGLGPRWATLLATPTSLAVGTYFIIDLLAQWQPAPWLASIAALTIVAAMLFVALAATKEWRARAVQVDRRQRVITVTTPRLIGTARRQLSFSEIADARAVTQGPSWRTFWGDGFYLLHAELRSKEIVALSHVAQAHERPALEGAAETIRRALA